MYIVNRQDLNEIFWRESEEDGWMHEDIGNLVRAYDAQLFAEKDIDKQKQVDCDCPVEDCESCEFNRSQSWCAQALPEYKGHTELEKIRMEGFWEAIDWCEKHYKWMEDHWDKLDAYTVLVTKILEECYANGRAPTEEDMFMIDTFWDDEET